MQPIGGSPESRPATAGPAPLNGTCVMSAFQRTWKRLTAVRWAAWCPCRAGEGELAAHRRLAQLVERIGRERRVDED